MTRREVGKALGLAALSTAALGELLHGQTASGSKKGGDSIGVDRLLSEAVPDIGGKEVRLVLLTVEPGGTSEPHRHTGPVFAYVLEGTIKTRWIRSRSGPTTRGTFFTSPPCMCIAR